MTEIKTQLDADTGEERRWEEKKIDEVIGFTGEDEGEGVAVDQAGSDEENQEGNGGEEEAINLVINEDDLGNKSEEEGDGERPERRDAEKADGNMADRVEADGGEIGGELVEGRGGEDDNRNGVDFGEAAERANISADHCTTALSPVSSSATTEAWEGEVRDEDVEMSSTEDPCFSRNVESLSPELDEKLPSPAPKESTMGGDEETVDTNLFPTIAITPQSPLAHLSGATAEKELGKSPVTKPSLASMAGTEGDSSNLASAPVLALAPAQPVEHPLSTGKSTQCTKLPSTVKDSTSLSLGGSLFASTSALPHEIQADAGSSGDSVAKLSVDKNSDAAAPGKAISEGTLKQCRVQLPRLTHQQKRRSGNTDGVEGVKQKQKSKAFKKENPPRVLKTEVVLTGEECIGCGEMFANMRRHQKLLHDVPCPNDCCERSFTSDEQLRKHMAENHGVFARGGVCKCGEHIPDDLEFAKHISQCAEMEDNK